MTRKLLILGATGSIGRQTLEVLRACPGNFRLEGIAAYGHDPEGLEEIMHEFLPPLAHIYDRAVAAQFQKKFPHTRIFFGKAGLRQIVLEVEDAIVLNALPGGQGLSSSRQAVRLGRKLVLANKESLVLAGTTLLRLARQTGAEIVPLDSELSALSTIFQNNRTAAVRRVYLPASGGPFRAAELWPAEKLTHASAAEALRHPTWKMGPKISIDSATLMNKAFELISIVRLFRIAPEQITVVIHPQSLLHAAVEFADGRIAIEAGPPDMRLCIARTLGISEYTQTATPAHLPFANDWHFEAPDEVRFPSLSFARHALQKGQRTCAALCRKNDELVTRFLNGEIRFGEILSDLAAEIGYELNPVEVPKTDLGYLREYVNSLGKIAMMSSVPESA